MKLFALLCILLLLLIQPLVIALSPGPSVSCCWQMESEEPVSGEENSCKDLNLTEEDCKSILASWNATEFSFSYGPLISLLIFAAIVLAVIVFLIVVGFVVYWFVKKKQK